MRNGGEVIVEYLVREGVPYVFGLCGHGNVGLLDALYDRADAIHVISTRHEQTAGHMADAFFRVAHRPVVTLTSCGPGSCNIPIALACAFMDSSAFCAITANVPTSQFNRAPFQETYRHFQADFPSVIRSYVKRSWQPTRTDMLPTALRQAFATMLTGRPGPVNIDVPFNVFKEPAEVDVPDPSWRAGISSRSGADAETVAAVLRALLEARRPLLYVGHGTTLSEAGAELTRLARRLQVPVIFSPNGFGTLDMTDPLALGFVGRNGAFPANEAARTCDVLLALGVRFDDRSSSSWIPGYSFNIPPTRLIHVDIDPAELGRNYPVCLGVVADVRTFLQQVLAVVDERRPNVPASRSAWLAEIAKWKAEWEEFVRPALASEDSPIHPLRVVDALRRVLPEDAIILPDSGVHHNWIVQFWRARRPQTVLNTWGFSAMGFGVCGVLGAKLAAPERACVAVCGDGGFMMRPDVLCTAVEYDIPAVWLIWNNYAYGAIRDIQTGLLAKREIATSFVRAATGQFYNPDFVALARACGADGLRVERPADLAPALEQALRAGRPFVLDVHVDRDIKPPGVGTWELPPLPHAEPGFGARRLPDEGDRP
jgi:acetolactate synthase-1/2/3 large subunit